MPSLRSRFAAVKAGWCGGGEPPPRPTIRVDLDCTQRYGTHLLLALARAGSLHLAGRMLERAVDWLDATDRDRVLRHQRRLARRPPDLLLTDRPATTEARRTVTVSYDVFAPGAQGYRVPFPLHPTAYRSGRYRELHTLRGRPARTRIFFAGTLQADSYTHEFDFPMLSRSAIYMLLAGHFASHLEHITDGRQPSREVAGTPPIRLVTTANVASTTRKFGLAPAAYFAALAGSSFALAPPGYCMPFSHNLTEAMSVGTIPILNYAHLMSPPLRDGVECLSFTDSAGFVAAIERALAMPPSGIARMRVAVADYYDRHMDVAGIARKLRSQFLAPAPEPLLLNHEVRSVGLRAGSTPAAVD